MRRNHQNQRKAIIVNICHIIYIFIRGSNTYDSHIFHLGDAILETSAHDLSPAAIDHSSGPARGISCILALASSKVAVASHAVFTFLHVPFDTLQHLTQKKAPRGFPERRFSRPISSISPHKKKKHKQGLFWAQSLAELSAISGAMGKGLNRGNCARRVDSAWEFFWRWRCHKSWARLGI